MQRERESCLIPFLSPLSLSSSSLINKINLYSDSFRLCAALQKGAISNLIKEDGIHVWKRLRAITCSYFITEIRLRKILWSISKTAKCNRYRAASLCVCLFCGLKVLKMFIKVKLRDVFLLNTTFVHIRWQNDRMCLISNILIFTICVMQHLH